MIATLLVSLLVIAQPVGYTGGQLLRDCALSIRQDEGTVLNSEQGNRSISCAAFVSGMLDGWGLGDYRVGGKEVLCPPKEGIETGQAIRITRSANMR